MASEDQQGDATKIAKELFHFDFVQFTVPDIHGIPRGRLVPKAMIDQACRDGVGIFFGSQWLGIKGELPTMVPDFNTFPNGNLYPLPSTSRLVPWISAPERRIGQVMCQMVVEGKALELCPRRTALRQLARLEKMGLKLKGAYELEFMVFDSKTMEPITGRLCPYANIEKQDPHVEFLTDLYRDLKQFGPEVEYIFPEYEPGQFELCMKPEYGVDAADAAFLVRYGVRALSQRIGYTTTFMAKPLYEFHTQGFHFNHSVWDTDGKDVFFNPLSCTALSSGGRSAVQGVKKEGADRLSEFAQNWIAGLLEHAPAITALSCPTVNCYHRLYEGFAPGKIYWNVDDRLCTIRAKTSKTGAYLENRIPSSACNPYVVLAATIAAGLDGVERKLHCPYPGPPQNDDAPGLPKTLAEALDCLEKDEVLKEALGSEFVEAFIGIKREYEVKLFETESFGELSKKERIMKEREVYMPFL